MKCFRELTSLSLKAIPIKDENKLEKKFIDCKEKLFLRIESKDI